MNLKVHIFKKFEGFSLKVDFDSDAKNIALLGPSGSGKSLTLKCIAGIIKPDEGHIELDGKVLFDSEKHINLPPQKRGVGYLFQSYALFPNMTVKKNILAGLHNEKDKEAKSKTLYDYARLLKISDVLDNYPHEISGGQAQRTALARILVSKPSILLLDEPFSALDAFLRNKLQMELKDILEEYNGQSIIVTHDRDEAYLLSDEIVLVDNGSIIIQKETKELFKDPEYIKAAILTGCKNFSPIIRVDNKTIFCKDWGLKIQLDHEIKEDITHVGIRAHHFNKDEKENKNEIKVVEFVEETFNYLVIFRFEHQIRDTEPLYWKVDKDVGVEPDVSQISFLNSDVLLLK